MSGDVIREQRKRLGYSQAELARILGVSRVTVARWECGARKVPPMALNFIRFLVEQKGGPDAEEKSSQSS